MVVGQGLVAPFAWKGKGRLRVRGRWWLLPYWGVERGVICLIKKILKNSETTSLTVKGLLRPLKKIR